MKKTECTDKKCPFHGTLSVRGRRFEGIVLKTDAHGTATVEWTRLQNIPKFERYEKRRTKVRVHNPQCLGAVKGDKVEIGETKPISKSKKFVITKKLGQDILFKQKEEAREEAKVKAHKEDKDASDQGERD